MEYYDKKIFGLVESRPGIDHGYIKVIGYVSKNTWKLTILNHGVCLKEFPTRGKVFAPWFFKYYPAWQEKLILFSVMESQNDGADEYLWNRDEETSIYANWAQAIPKGLNVDDPNFFYNYLTQKNCLVAKEEKIFYTSNRLFVVNKSDLKNYMIQEYHLEQILKAYPEKIFRYEDGIIVTRTDFGKLATKKDVMPNQVLKEWVINDFLQDEWYKVFIERDNFLVRDSLIKLFSKSGIPKNIVNERLGRTFDLIDTIKVSYTQIQKLLQFEPLHQALEVSLEIHKEELWEDIKRQNQKEISEYEQKCHTALEAVREDFVNAQEDYKQKKAQLEADFDVKKKEFEKKCSSLEEEFKKKNEQQQNQISSLEQECQSLQNRTEELKQNIELLSTQKAGIIQEYSVIKEVLSMMGSPYTPTSGVAKVTPKSVPEIDVEIFTESIVQADQIIKTEKEFKERLAFFLENNNRQTDISKKLIALLIYYKVLLLPDIRVLNAIIKATGLCRYVLCTVTPEWRSYSRLFESGLKSILEDCYENPGIMHYLVLQNIDMSSLPCYFQPIIDVIVGLCPAVPRSKYDFPDNLRILSTVSQGEGLPLCEGIIKYFGCIEKKDYSLDKKEENVFEKSECNTQGYLAPECLIKWNKDNVTETQYQSYLSKDEDDE